MNKAISDYSEITSFNGDDEYVLIQKGNQYYKAKQKWLGLGLVLVELTLSQSQIQALSTTPQTLLAAQGVGTVIVPVSVACFMDYNGTAYATATTLRLKHSGQSNTLYTTSSSFVTATADRYEKMVESTTGAATQQQQFANTGLVIDANANAINAGGVIYVRAMLQIFRF